MNKIKILLVDDHAVMRMGLVSLLGTCRELDVVGDASDGPGGIRKALKTHPDVIIMDMEMPEMNGAETTRQLLKKQPDAKVLVLTTFGTSDGLADILKAGAKGALLKSAELDELRTAISEVASGKTYLSSEVEQILTDDPPLPELSPRQREILLSIARGLSNADIALQLGISVPMVKEHLSALFQKLDVANRTEAVALALRKRISKL